MAYRHPINDNTNIIGPFTPANFLILHSDISTPMALSTAPTNRFSRCSAVCRRGMGDILRQMMQQGCLLEGIWEGDERITGCYQRMARRGLRDLRAWVDETVKARAG